MTVVWFVKHNLVGLLERFLPATAVRLKFINSTDKTRTKCLPFFTYSGKLMLELYLLVSWLSSFGEHLYDLYSEKLLSDISHQQNHVSFQEIFDIKLKTSNRIFSVHCASPDNGRRNVVQVRFRNIEKLL